MLLSNGRTINLAPQAFAETSPVSYQGYFLPNLGLTLEQRFATYGALYKEQPWVAAVVNKIAHLIARLGIQVWDESSPTGKTADTTGPFARLIANPCATLDPYSFWLWVASTFEIYGEAFLLKLRNDAGQVTSLVPMHPSRTQIERDLDGGLLYRFMGHPAELIPEADVVPFVSYNPDGAMRGWSRLEPLRSTLMSEDSSRRATQAWWKNMGRPSVILSSPDKKIAPEAANKLRDQWNAAYGGSGNVGKAAVLTDGLTAQPIQLNAEEMQYIETRRLNREEVCGVYDIPPSAVHILDNATYSNITEQMRSVYRDTMAPRLEFIESVLNAHLGAGFYGPKFARFDVSAVLRGDFETRAQAIAPLVQSGVYKPAEARDLFDLNDAGEVADRLYANAAIQPLGTPAERITLTGQELEDPDGIPIANPEAPTPAAAPTDTPTPPPAKQFERLIRRHMGRGKSLDSAVALVDKAHPGHWSEITQAANRIAVEERTKSHA